VLQNMKVHTFKFRFLAILLLYFSTTVFSLLNAPGTAKAANSISIKDQVSSFTTLYIMSNELGNGNECPINSTLDYEHVNNKDISYVTYDIGGGENPKPRKSFTITDVADPDNSGQSFDGTNHKWFCNDFFSHTVTQLWGYKDYLEFLRDIGYTCSAGNCTTSKSDEAKFNLLITSLKNKKPGLFENITNTSWNNFTPNDVIKYYVYSQVFFAPDADGGNGGAQTTLVANPSELQKGVADDSMMHNGAGHSKPFLYKAYVVTNDFNVKENVYSSPLDYNTILQIIQGVNSNNSETTPGELARFLDKNNPSLAKTAAPTLKSHDTNPPTPGTGSGGNNDSTCTATDGTCLASDCQASFADFGWILCPIINKADSAFQWAKSLIFSLLSVSTGSVNSSGGLKQAWAASKNIASAGIILVGIIMVGSQVLGIEIFSAYTVKKILPKLIAATILMQLSWYIFITMIDIANAIGFGLYQLLINAFNTTDAMGILGTQPAPSTNQTIVANLLGAGITAGGTFVAASVLIGVFSGGAEGLFIGLILAMVGAVISILTTIITLIIRKVAIVFLIVLSPLALLAWVLPGTQSLWNQWWKNFSKLLAMFPLITLLFAAGAIGSHIVADNNSVNLHGLDVIMIVVVYFAPLFLIPKTFKFSGTMFAAAAGAMATIGDKTKNGKMLSGMREKNKASKAYNKDKAMLANRTSSNPLRRRYGNAQARLGLLGASGAYRDKQLGDAANAGEENAYAGLTKTMSGMDGTARISMAADIATGKKKSSEVEKAAAMRYLMETSSVAELEAAQAANTDPATGKTSSTWNNFQAKNYTPLSNLSPEFVGKKWEDLSPEALVSKSGSSLQAFNNWSQKSSANAAAAQSLRTRVLGDSTLAKNLTAGHLKLFQNIDDINNGRTPTHPTI